MCDCLRRSPVAVVSVLVKMELANILKQWQLEEVISVCEINGIDTLDLLKQLVEDDSELQAAIKNLKTRLVLKSKLKELNRVDQVEQSKQIGNDWKSLGEDSFSCEGSRSIVSGCSASNNIIIEPETLAETTTVLPLPGTSFDSPGQDIIILTNVERRNNDIEEEPPLKKRHTDNIDVNLNDLLNETVTGKAIKAHYNQKGSLDSICQSYLVDIIVQKYLNSQPFKRLTNEDFAALAKEIVRCFPKELQEVYYTPPLRKRQSRDHKSGIARGKLVDKYRNRLTFLRKNGIIKSSRESSSDEDHSSQASTEEVQDVDEEILWLKHNNQPWSLVEEKWKKTYSHRQQCLKGDIDIKDFLQMYPILTHELGYSLIDLDFQRRFSDQYQLLFVNFEKQFRKLLNVRKNHLGQSDALLLNIIESEGLSADSRHYLMFTILTSLIPQRSFPKKFPWKPTISESKDGVVTHATTAGDVATIINERKEKMKKYNLPLQPYVICEGPTYDKIKTIYVSYDNITYEVPSFLKSLDVCFQLMHVLNLEYPYESEHIWMFLQIAMYNLTTQYDKLPAILDIVNKVNNVPD